MFNLYPNLTPILDYYQIRLINSSFHFCSSGFYPWV